MDTKKIGSYIQKKRREYHLTQEELANKVYVTNKAVSRWENGKSLPEVETLYLLSKVLHVSINEILDEGVEKDEEIKEYYNQKRVRSKNTMFDIFLFVVIFFLMMVTVYQIIELTLGVALVYLDVEFTPMIKETFAKTRDTMFEYVLLNVIPWIVMLVGYIGYKLKNKILYFTSIVSILIVIVSLFASDNISVSHIAAIVVSLFMLWSLRKDENEWNMKRK